MSVLGGSTVRRRSEWLLYTGVITWGDVPWRLTDTGRLPADVFARPLESRGRAKT